MGLMQIIKEEKQKFKEMGTKAYIENLVNNEEIYGQLSEKQKEDLLVMGKTLCTSGLEGKERTELSFLEVATRGICRGTITGLGTSYRIKKQR